VNIKLFFKRSILVVAVGLMFSVAFNAQADSWASRTSTSHEHVTGHGSIHVAGHSGWHGGWRGGWARPVVVAGWWGGCGYAAWWRDPFYYGPYGYPYGYCGADPLWWDAQPSGQVGVSYQWDPKSHRYVALVPTDSATAVAMPTVSTELFVYPRNAQSDEQQGKDKFECHQWAAKQSNFDPTVPAATNLSAPQMANQRMDYRRAMAACLDARGYSVQ